MPSRRPTTPRPRDQIVAFDAKTDGGKERMIAELARVLSDAGSRLRDMETSVAELETGDVITLPISMTDVSGLIAALAAKSALGHTHPESDIVNLIADLAAKVATSRLINTTAPLTGGGNLSADLTLGIDSYAGGAPGAVPVGTGSTTKYLREDGAWGVPSGINSGFFGDGSHGDLDFDGLATVLGVTPTTLVVAASTGIPAGTYQVYSMTDEVYAEDMIVGSAVIVDPGCFRIFVKETLTLEINSIIDSSGGDGGSGAVSLGGTRGPAPWTGGFGTNTLRGGGDGGAGGSASGGAGAVGVARGQVYRGATAGAATGGTGNGPSGGPGQGGAGGGNGASTGASGGTVTVGNTGFTLHTIWQAINGRSLDATAIGPGTGGGGGRGSSVANTGGGGGGGASGGFVMVAAKNIIDNGSHGLHANGGWGGAAYFDAGLGTNNCGGGAGGAGGIVVCIQGEGDTPTLQANGGTGGAHGNTGGGTGGNGGNGFTASFRLGAA